MPQLTSTLSPGTSIPHTTMKHTLEHHQQQKCMTTQCHRTRIESNKSMLTSSKALVPFHEIHTISPWTQKYHLCECLLGQYPFTNKKSLSVSSAKWNKLVWLFQWTKQQPGSQVTSLLSWKTRRRKCIYVLTLLHLTKQCWGSLCITIHLMMFTTNWLKLHALQSSICKRGYWQVPLDDESSHLTTFDTPFGHYQFTRLPFGIIVSGDAFQIKLDAINSNLPHTISIADDMTVWGEKGYFSDHDKVLERYTQVTRQNNLHLSINKIQYHKDHVEFFGTIYTTKGHKPH